jgi:cytochrome c oxidase subunit 3
VFVGVKSFEYRDKLTHYDVVLNDGMRVDGHLVEKTEEFITLSHPVSYPAEKGIAYRPIAIAEMAKAEAAHADDEHAADDAHAGGHGDVTIQMADVKKMTNWGPWANTYFAIYFTMTFLHGLHVVGGVLVIAYLWGPGAKMWKTDPERYTNRIEVSGLFWHFVDLVWIFLFPVLYLL